MHKLGQGSSVHFNSTTHGNLANASLLTGIRVYPKPADENYVCRSNDRGTNFLSNIGASYMQREWNPEQERQLLLHVQQFGEKSWSKTGRVLKKSAMECRDRWNSVLRPILIQAKRQQDLNNLAANKGRTSINRTSILQKSRSQQPPPVSNPNLASPTSPSPYFRLDNPVNWTFLLNTVRSRSGSGGTYCGSDENRRSAGSEDRKLNPNARTPLSNVEENCDFFDTEVESNGSLIDELDPNLSHWVNASNSQVSNIESSNSATPQPISLSEPLHLSRPLNIIQTNTSSVKPVPFKRPALSPPAMQSHSQRRSISVNADENVAVENYVSESFRENMKTAEEGKSFVNAFGAITDYIPLEPSAWCSLDKEDSCNPFKNFSLPWGSQSQDKENWPESAMSLVSEEDPCLNNICQLPVLTSPSFGISEFGLDFPCPTLAKSSNISETVSLTKDNNLKMPFDSKLLEEVCRPKHESISCTTCPTEISVSPDESALLVPSKHALNGMDLPTLPIVVNEHNSSTSSNTSICVGKRSTDSVPDSHNPICLMEKFQSLMKREVPPLDHRELVSTSYWDQWLNGTSSKSAVHNHYQPPPSRKSPPPNQSETKSSVTKEYKSASSNSTDKPVTRPIILCNFKSSSSSSFTKPARVTVVRPTSSGSSELSQCIARPLVTRRVVLRSEPPERLWASTEAGAKYKMPTKLPFYDPHVHQMRNIRQVIQRCCDSHWRQAVIGSANRNKDSEAMVASAYKYLESCEMKASPYLDSTMQ